MSLIPWICAAAAAGVAGYTNPTPQPGEPSYVPGGQHHMRLLFENDSFCNDDGDYTHGTRIDYAQNMKDGNAWGVSLLQNIYTPSTNRHEPVPDERPYAGYLAVGAAYMLRGKDFGSTFEFQLGVTGKPSLAEDAQWLIHDMGKMYQWHGWAHQLDSEVTFQFNARQDYRLRCLESDLFGLETDGTLFTREELGTVSVAASVGLSLRIGRNLPDSMRVNGSKPGDYGISLFETGNYRPDELSWFIVSQTHLKYVGHDMFLDGGVFHRAEVFCSKNPWVFESQLGFGVSYKNIDYYLGGVFQSRSYQQQAHNEVFGTFSVTWHW